MRSSKFSIVLFFSIILLSCRNPNQIAKIEYKSLGCIGLQESQLVIYKEKDNTLAKLDIKGGRSLKTTLNVAQIDSFNLFIKELKLIKGEGCTTEETFIIQFNDEVINKVIRNCEWNGFFRLKQLLFLGK